MHLTVHWDGKLLKESTTHKHVDRLPVLVSGAAVEQLLGVPKLSSGTGKEQASAVLHCLAEWGVGSPVVALCFDTTASNTGRHAGACTLVELIERGLDKNLIFLACRHHILELVVGAAFEKTAIGVSSGPEILIFKRFKDRWLLVDHESFRWHPQIHQYNLWLHHNAKLYWNLPGCTYKRNSQEMTTGNSWNYL